MAKERAVLTVEGKPLPVSNLPKVMFPETELTKGEIMDYYIRISPHLLPHLHGRPVTMKRYPDGVRGASFYEKNAPAHTPKWVETAEVARKTRGGRIRYILINDLRTLLWTVNLGNLEMHTLLARAPDLQTPTSVVFDLDPGPGTGILDCAAVAFRLRALFERAGLQAWPKPSGSKGLQLFLPLNRPAGYEATGAFARGLADALEREDPDLVVARMSKAKRAGKVFIDWSQNSEHKTTVAPYSLRAKRERPFVSLPVTWEELEAACARHDPDALYFSPEAALKRAEELGDLFSPVLTLEQSLPSDPAALLARNKGARKPKAATGAASPRKGSTRKTTKAGAASGSPVGQSSGGKPRRSRKSAADKKPAADSLERYAAKRDFTRTGEPPPDGPATSSPALRFVVQEHHASRVHFDFRLEMDGVLRSWAVPKGIPLRAKEKRLAIQVEDHPLEYGDFEGTIPPGNYGAGTVMLWDSGTYEVREDPATRGWENGKLHLTLKGRKLKGEWHLFRFKGRDADSDNSWFLLKTGANAPAPRRPARSVATGRTIKEIAAADDRTWSSTEGEQSTAQRPRKASRRSTRKKAPPQAQFVPPMLATLRGDLPEGGDWQYEIKLDGYRCIAVKNGTDLRLYSRNQRDLTATFPHIAEALRRLPAASAVLDGEIVALEESGRPNFQALQNRRSSDLPIVCYLFDLPDLDGEDLCAQPLEARQERLKRLLAKVDDPIRFSSALAAEPQALIQRITAAGLEGIIAKRRSSPYEPGERSRAWVKYKTRQEATFVIGGYLPSRKNFESLLIGEPAGRGALRFLAKVKDGFVPHTRQAVFEKLLPYRAGTCPFSNLPEAKGSRRGKVLDTAEMKKCVWLKPALKCTVAYTERTGTGNLRHAWFVSLGDAVRKRRRQ